MKTETKRAELLHSFKSTISIFMITVISISAIVYLIWQRNSVDTVMRDIDQLRNQQNQVRAENNRLKRQITTLKSFKRISKLAKSKFALEPPKTTPVRIVVNNERYSADKDKIRLALSEKKRELIKLRVIKAGL